MRIHLLSDIHLEIDPKRRERWRPEVLDADVTILAGDIDQGPRVPEWASRAFPGRVLIVAGNHEFYSGHLQRTARKMREASTDRVQFMDCDEVLIDGVRFLGGTAWTDLECLLEGEPPERHDWLRSMSSMFVAKAMTDYRRIRTNRGLSEFARLTPGDTAAAARSFKAWLVGKLAEPFDGKTVVVTHHAPLRSVAYPSRPTALPMDFFDAGYCNHWPELVAPPVDLWMWGHTHEAVDTTVNGVRLVSNPCGYSYGEDTGFDPWKIIEL
jgi:predicted phosphodiesterase